MVGELIWKGCMGLIGWALECNNWWDQVTSLRIIVRVLHPHAAWRRRFRQGAPRLCVLFVQSGDSIVASTTVSALLYFYDKYLF